MSNLKGRREWRPRGELGTKLVSARRMLVVVLASDIALVLEDGDSSRAAIFPNIDQEAKALHEGSSARELVELLAMPELIVGALTIGAVWSGDVMNFTVNKGVKVVGNFGDEILLGTQPARVACPVMLALEQNMMLGVSLWIWHRQSPLM